jgi:hypothetical protein
MNIRNTFSRAMLLLAIGLAWTSVVAVAAPQNANGSRVEISWTNPADFSEAKMSPGSGLGRQAPDEWLGELAKHLRYRAERVLPSDQHLQVTFTNVQRAGIYEPWRGPRWDDVRIIKDLYPPRLDLDFTLTDANGGVVKQGTRELRDPSFLQRGILNETDPLRFEKRMLDDWLRNEFPDAGGARG